MSARDIIRNVLLDERDIDGCLHLSDSILEALTSAGYRILAPGAEERLAKWMAQDHVDQNIADEYTWEDADDIWRESWRKKAAAAIRALGGGEG